MADEPGYPWWVASDPTHPVNRDPDELAAEAAEVESGKVRAEAETLRQEVENAENALREAGERADIATKRAEAAEGRVAELSSLGKAPDFVDTAGQIGPGKAGDAGYREMEPVGSGVMAGSALHSEGAYVPPAHPGSPRILPVEPDGTTRPYSAVTAKGLAGEDRWDVVDANGISTRYIGETDNSEDGAKARAAFLNTEPVVETQTYTDGSSATGQAPLPNQSPEVSPDPALPPVQSSTEPVVPYESA
jgi:hypothetical protein